MEVGECGWVPEVSIHRDGIAQLDGGPDIGGGRFGLGGRAFVGGISFGSKSGRQGHHRQKGDHPEEARKEHPPATMPQEGLQPLLPPEHGREESAHEHEERHSEAMDPGLKNKGRLGLGHILDKPGESLGKGEGDVVNDAEQHGGGAKGIEVMPTFVGCRRSAHCGCRRGAHG